MEKPQTIISSFLTTAVHPNRIFDKNLFDCQKCNSFGMELVGCNPFGTEINAKYGIYIPDWIYEECDTCKGTGKVEDLFPEHQMD